MAQFVQYDPSEQGINFTGRSQGYTHPLEVVGKSMKGLAQTASLFMENRDKEQKNALIKDADAAADSILSGIPDNAMPFSAAPLPEPGDRENRVADMPAGLAQGLDNFNRYAKAYTKGGNSDLDVYAKMLTAAKQLKAKYPGHVEDVDNLIMSALNSKPANVIRKELNSLVDAELKKQAEGADSSTKFYRQWASTNSEYIAAAGYKISDLDFSNENQMRTLWNHVSQIQADDLKTTQTKNRLELDTQLGNVEVKRYKTLAAKEIGNKVDQSLRAGSPLFDAFIKAKTAGTSKDSPGGVEVTPEEQAEISQTFGAVASQLQLEANSLINGEFYLKGMPSKSDRDDVLGAVNERLKVYQDMLDNKMYGLFNGVNNQIKSKYDQTELDTLNGKYGDYTRMVLQATKNGIPLESIDAALTAMYGEAGLADMKLKAARQYVTTGVVTGAIPNLGTAIDDAGKDGITDPAFYRKTLADTQFILTDPNQDPKIVDNVAKATYQSQNNDELLKQFGKSSRRQVFNQLTDPRIFERLKGTENYALAETWAKNQFAGLHKEDMDTIIANQSIIGKDISIMFDPKTSTFKVVEDPRFSKPLGDSVFVNPRTAQSNQMSMEALRVSKVKSAVVSMNADLAKIHKIVEGGQSGLEPSEETKLLLNLSGFHKLPEVIQDSIMSNPAQGSKDTSGLPREISDFGKSIEEAKAAGRITPASPILTLLGKAEGADFNTIYGGDKVDLSNMTVAQVVANQRTQTKTKGSSATGKFQVMRKTLTDLIKNGVVSPNEKFTPALQERIAHALLEKRGYTDYISGVITADEFADNLAKEWASLPLANGKSYYHNDGVNKATISRAELMDMIEGLTR